MFRISSLFAILLLFLAAAGTASAQRDYFTPEEVELIRETQQIDKRIGVLIHAIDRRFAVLKLDVAAPKRTAKNETWGELPTGTRTELLIDIKRILQKAIDDIDSLAERPDSFVPDAYEKKPKGFGELFPVAVRSLAAAARRYGPVLKAEIDREGSPTEKGSILSALEMCDQIIAASAKLPAPSK